MEIAARIVETLAALLLAVLPAALLFWFLIHPFVDFWRRRGPFVTYATVSVICLAAVYAIWSQREALLARHFGFHAATVSLGVALFVLGAVWDWRVLRKLRFPVLAGLPELSEAAGIELLTDGPFAVVRHPRYLGALLGMVGFALICNYFWLYVVIAASIPLGWLLVVLEERELTKRFGDEYVEYCRSVPRFFPRRP